MHMKRQPKIVELTGRQCDPPPSPRHAGEGRHPRLSRIIRTSFSEEKEAKRLLLRRAVAAAVPAPPGAEVFLVTFFSKKVTS
jgi:hypothetical protein